MGGEHDRLIQIRAAGSISVRLQRADLGAVALEIGERSHELVQILLPHDCCPFVAPLVAPITWLNLPSADWSSPTVSRNPSTLSTSFIASAMSSSACAIDFCARLI